MLLHQLHTESRRNFLRFHCPTDRNLKKPNSYEDKNIEDCTTMDAGARPGHQQLDGLDVV